MRMKCKPSEIPTCRNCPRDHFLCCLPWQHLRGGLQWTDRQVLLRPQGCWKGIHQQQPCNCNRPSPARLYPSPHDSQLSSSPSLVPISLKIHHPPFQKNLPRNTNKGKKHTKINCFVHAPLWVFHSSITAYTGKRKLKWKQQSGK